jgi:hypothetical protein
MRRKLGGGDGDALGSDTTATRSDHDRGSSTLNDREIARCLRHNREPLDLTAAAVLHRALTCSREDPAPLSAAPTEHMAAEGLIAAGLLENVPDVLRPTPRAEATFRVPRTHAVSADPHQSRALGHAGSLARCVTKRCQRADQM